MYVFILNGSLKVLVAQILAANFESPLKKKTFPNKTLEELFEKLVHKDLKG